MVDWDAMHEAYENAAERDILHFLNTEVNIASAEGDKFLVNLYGRAIAEIKHLRSVIDNLKAEVQYYQSQQRG